MRLREDELRLAAGVLFQLLGRLLRRDECRAEEVLELAEAHEVGLELLDLVGEIGALSPHVFEAHCDLVEQRVDARSAVTADEGLVGLEMSDFDGGKRHGLPFQCTRLAMLVSTARRM